MSATTYGVSIAAMSRSESLDWSASTSVRMAAKDMMPQIEAAVGRRKNRLFAREVEFCDGE